MKMNVAQMMAVAMTALGHPWVVMDLLKAGLLNTSLRPMIARGAEKYLKAIAAGDVAGGFDVGVRELACARCSARAVATSPGGISGWKFEWCGVPLHELVSGEKAQGHERVLAEVAWRDVDWGKVEGPACGCLLELKRLVASEGCPRGEWGAVTPVRLTVGGEAVGRGAV